MYIKTINRKIELEECNNFFKKFPYVKYAKTKYAKQIQNSTLPVISFTKNT